VELLEVAPGVYQGFPGFPSSFQSLHFEEKVSSLVFEGENFSLSERESSKVGWELHCHFLSIQRYVTALLAVHLDGKSWNARDNPSASDNYLLKDNKKMIIIIWKLWIFEFFKGDMIFSKVAQNNWTSKMIYIGWGKKKHKL